MLTITFLVRSRREINLRDLDMVITTDSGEYQVRWSVETHGQGEFVYWSDMVVRGTTYNVRYKLAALGDAALTYRQI